MFLFLASALAAVAAFADEGMWMPQQIPQIAGELKKAGLQIDPNRLADLTGDPMGAIVSLDFCSASFVSPQGLIVTNHHCGFTALQYNSTPQRDLITTGFLAKTLGDELQGGPGLHIFVTNAIDDVTKDMTGKLTGKMTDIDRSKALERRSKEIVGECEKQPNVRCRVASIFEGSQYVRITQMDIKDVRLVYSPTLGVGDFGGETDNWMWPRHTGDYTFLRAYVGKDGKPADYSKDNVPYQPAHFLKVSTEGVNPGDLVFVAGYPGRTFRYKTGEEISMDQEFTYPTSIKYFTDLTAILNAQGKGHKDIEIKNASRIKGFDNTMKNFTGTLANFKSGDLSASRRKQEADLAAYIAADPKRSAAYSNVLAEISRIDRATQATRERDAVLNWLYRSSPELGQAHTLYRLSVEKTKKDLDRLPGYQERDLPRIKDGIERQQRVIEPSSDRAGLRYFLNEAAKLPATERIKAVDDALASTGVSGTDAQIEKFLDRLYGSTKIQSVEDRRAMASETTAQLKARNDAMLNFAAALLPLREANENRDRATEGAMSRLRPKYFEALKGMRGGVLYPDANSTLRITFGKVIGYKARDAVKYEPQTTLAGVLQKNTGEGEFDSPKNLLDAARAKKTDGYVDPQLGDVPVDFLSTCDTTGGNSGSATMNAKGELCGLLFDGNYEAMGSDYLVNPALTRSIHVDIKYVLWIMDAVDGAQNLLREMSLPVHYEK